MKIKSVILLVCTLFFGLITKAEDNSLHHALAGKHLLVLAEEEPDAQDCFEDSLLVLTEIHAKRPCRIRSRFYAAPSFFIISSFSKTEEITVTDDSENQRCPIQHQRPELPFYYLFLFRLTPF